MVILVQIVRVRYKFREQSRSEEVFILSRTGSGAVEA